MSWLFSKMLYQSRQRHPIFREYIELCASAVSVRVPSIIFFCLYLLLCPLPRLSPVMIGSGGRLAIHTLGCLDWLKCVVPLFHFYNYHQVLVDIALYTPVYIYIYNIPPPRLKKFIWVFVVETRHFFWFKLSCFPFFVALSTAGVVSG